MQRETISHRLGFEKRCKGTTLFFTEQINVLLINYFHICRQLISTLIWNCQLFNLPLHKLYLYTVMNLLDYVQTKRLFNDAITAHLNLYPTIKHYKEDDVIGREDSGEIVITDNVMLEAMYEFLHEYNLNPSAYNTPKEFLLDDLISEFEESIIDNYASMLNIIIHLTKDGSTVYELHFDMVNNIITHFEISPIIDYIVD